LVLADFRWYPDQAGYQLVELIYTS